MYVLTNPASCDKSGDRGLLGKSSFLVGAISQLLLMDSLLMIDSVLLAVVLDLVESSGDSMKETRRRVLVKKL
jgi:hypothetical protein